MGKMESMLRSEILRLAKKEAKALVRPLLSQVAGLKKEVGILKDVKTLVQPLTNQVTRLKDEVVLLQEGNTERDRLLGEMTQKISVLYTPDILLTNVAGGSNGRSRLSGGVIKKLRKKLKITQEDFAGLIGVSGVTVGYWEAGKVKPKPEYKAKIFALRQYSVPEVTRMLEV